MSVLILIIVFFQHVVDSASMALSNLNQDFHFAKKIAA